MKLIAQIKLQPNKAQYQSLKQTLKWGNKAADWISEWAWENKTFNKFAIQKALYHDIRSKFDLSAQLTLRVISKVADAYKLDKKTQCTFRPTGSIAYDDRNLSYKTDMQIISILSLNGRLKIPFVCGTPQKELLKTRQGESDLCLFDGVFYLLVTCNVEEPPLIDIDGFLGIDLGIKSIAVSSDGEVFSGTHLNNIRIRYANLRSKLQHTRTEAAKKLLKKRNKKEGRFSRHTNHAISKHLVDKAKGTGRGIALEDLTGIRTRVTVKREQRYIHHSWAFHDLVQKIKYKAVLAGVSVVLIDPRNTSRECSVCGFISKANRKTQADFLCLSCGFSENADINAARVIASRAACKPASS